MSWGPRDLRFYNGAVTAPGQLSAPRRPARMIVFIHGFNNDRDQARNSYNAVMRLLPSHDHADVWRFFWPGFVEKLTATISDSTQPLAPRRDMRGTESNSLLSAASYSLQVAKSKEVGAALGAFLEGAQPSSLVFVAHSLGCRVTLEAIRHLTRPDAVRAAVLTGACLMAAAVPTYMIDFPLPSVFTAGLARGQLRAAASAIDRSYVLHSTSDLVLQGAFRVGQTAAGEGFFPEAVGTHGKPHTPWSARGDTGLGHSGYWTHPSAAPATLRALGQANDASLLSLPTLHGVTWRLTPEHSVPDRELTRRGWVRTGSQLRLV